MLLIAALRAGSAPGAPGYRVVELGSGAPVDMNVSGTVVGIEGTSSAPISWIVATGTRSLLPLPVGATYATVNRVSAGGAAVGHVSGLAVVWQPGNGSATWIPTWIPLPTGARVCLPTGIRDMASGPQVLLNCGTPSFLSSPTNLMFSSSVPYLYSQNEGLLDLLTCYGLSYAFAADMTGGGSILTNAGTILEPDGSITAAPRLRLLAGLVRHAVQREGRIRRDCVARHLRRPRGDRALLTCQGLLRDRDVHRRDVSVLRRRHQRDG